jgi:sarcosine oxidase subunit beta
MQRSLGLEVSLVDAEEITDIVPILDVKGINAIGATFCPTDGHADPFKTTYAYAKNARENGTKIYPFTEVIDIIKKNGEIKGVETSRGSIEADFVVNAAGAWSKQIAAMADIEVPNIPYRKEILVTERLENLFESMVISFQDGIYFSQLADGQVIGGIPIPHEKPGYMTVPTFEFLQHMSKTLTRYAPCLKFLKVVRQWTGFYDVTPDALPIVGKVDEMDGFIQCHGFSGHGFMVAPMITQLLAELIIDGKPSMSIERLELKRFEKKGLIKEKNVVG